MWTHADDVDIVGGEGEDVDEGALPEVDDRGPPLAVEPPDLGLVADERDVVGAAAVALSSLGLCGPPQAVAATTIKVDQARSARAKAT